MVLAWHKARGHASHSINTSLEGNCPLVPSYISITRKKYKTSTGEGATTNQAER